MLRSAQLGVDCYLMTEPHICQYTHDCPTLDEFLPRFYEAPTLTFGSEHYGILCTLLILNFEYVIERLDMLGLDDSVMAALNNACDVIASELMCENVVHKEIFEQFLRDVMKFLPALQAAHRV
jgi:hypothetical protein